MTATCSRWSMSRIEYLAMVERRQDRIVELTRQGHTAATIASILNCSKRTVQRVRSERGIAQPVHFEPMTSDELRRALVLLEDGCSYGEVGRTLGRTTNTISRHFPGYGWGVSGGGWITALNRRAAEMGVAL